MLQPFTPTNFVDHTSVINAAFLNSFQAQVKNITDFILERQNTIILFDGTIHGESVPTTSGSTVNVGSDGIVQSTLWPIKGDIVLDINSGYLGIVPNDPGQQPQDFDVKGLGIKLNFS